MISLGSGPTKLLGRLAINPSIRQAHLARELDVSRSAVNQLWKKLERENNLRIMSNIDYGAIGIQSIYGWASTGLNPQSLSSFQTWIENNSLTKMVFKSLMTSKMDNRVFFEALVPRGKTFELFLSSLERYRKKPHNLDITYGYASAIANHFNFGYFDGTRWNFESDYRFEASIDAARSFADILPVVHSRRQSPPRTTTIETIATAAALESNFLSTSSDLAKILSRFDMPTQSNRTLRRRLKSLRSSIAQPYLSLDNVGLTQKVIITLEESEQSDIYKLLRTQAASFPKVRVLTGNDSMGMILELPQRTNWLHISNIMANITRSHSETCTFIAEQVQNKNWLESIVQNMMKTKV